MNETRTTQTEATRARAQQTRQTLALAALIAVGLLSVIALSRWMDARRPATDVKLEEERLYLTGNTLKRMSLGFNGLVADWYWMRSLQYVGNKIINHHGEVQVDNLKPLDMRLLYPLLDTATTLDPQFLVAYKYGAVVLPAINEEDAIKLIRKGMAHNPDDWRLYQHLGYIYWKRGDYKQASEVYAEGAKKGTDVPVWMKQMSARMLAEGGSPATAREIYQRLYEESEDAKVKDVLLRRLMQVDSFEERDAIRAAFKNFQQRVGGRCPNTWRELATELRAVRLSNGKPLRLDAAGVPLDPADTPYVLKNNCAVDLDTQSRVPYQ
jgi:tetratricopeptide (TPR) repeat protein